MREPGEQGVVVAVRGERGEERGQAGHVADGGGQGGAVEVGAEADVILAELGLEDEIASLRARQIIS